MIFKKYFQWLIANVASISMVMLPVAQGQAAQTQREIISKATVQRTIAEMGLNRSMTYGEFFKKNKDLYPLRLQRELEPYFTRFAKERMPQFDVGTVKGSDGFTYPTIRISQKGQLHNVQIFGETEKYAKLNSTVLSEVDLINLDDALTKIAASDMKIREQFDQNFSFTPSTPPKKSFPNFDAVAWAKLTPQQRAGYVMSMRILYNDAHGVLLAANPKNKSTQKGKKFSFIDEILGAEANAAFEPDLDPDPTAQAKTLPTPSKDLDSCLVAGYVTRYKGKVCKYSEMIRSYDQKRSNSEGKEVDNIAFRAIKECGNKISCNPLIFGAPEGRVRCIDRARNDQVQVATHYEGPCEEGNHTASRIDFLKDEKAKIDRYGKNAKMTAAEIEAEALKQQTDQIPSLESTRKFIDGVLKYNEPGLVAAFTSKKPDSRLIAELLRIKSDFDNEIQQATSACKAASDHKRDHESNFWKACDQLQRRFIFIAEYLDKNPGCADKTPVNKDTLMCGCSGSSPAETLPGEICATPLRPPLPTIPSKDPTVVIPPDPAVVTLPVVDPSKCDPACKAGEECKLAIAYDKKEVWQCVGNPIPKNDPKKIKKGGGFARFLKSAAPILVGVAAVAGAYFLWKPKKVKLNPAGDLCPDGSAAPCATQCVSPKVNVAGVCACAACVPGQTHTNLNTCDCGTTAATKILCADGVTYVNTFAECPVGLYTCWDGSKVPNLINCPEKPATKTNSSTR